MVFESKFSVHKYIDDIYKKFDEKDTTIKDIQNWLVSLGEEYKLSWDCISRHRKRYLDDKAQEKAFDDAKQKATKEFGKETGDIEDYLLETITQCRLKKEIKGISGKDYQYYDQQMQSAIKLLNESKSQKRGDGVSLSDIFEKLGNDIAKDTNEKDLETGNSTGTDNKVS